MRLRHGLAQIQRKTKIRELSLGGLGGAAQRIQHREQVTSDLNYK